MVTLTQIYASKIFKASNRKEKILSAFNTSGLNIQLTVQSPDSVEDAYKPMTRKPDTSPEPQDEENKDENQSIRDSKHSASPSGSHSSSSSLPSFDDLVDVPDFSDVSDEPSDSDEPAPEPNSNPDDDIAESTDISGVTDIDTESTVKSALDTADPSIQSNRVKYKGDELWIYYNDDINLNNIMTDVIDLVEDKCPYMQFNRLARSENAIVFQGAKSAEQ